MLRAIKKQTNYIGLSLCKDDKRTWTDTKFGNVRNIQYNNVRNIQYNCKLLFSTGIWQFRQLGIVLKLLLYRVSCEVTEILFLNIRIGIELE